MAVASEEQGYVTGRVHLPLFNSSSRNTENENLDVKMESLCRKEKMKSGNSNSDSVVSDTNCNYYGLRENPKKPCKLPGFRVSCQECGKGFDTERALFGHMRWHSVKSKKCGEGFDSTKSSFLRDHDDDYSDRVVMEMDSSFCPVRRKRTRVFYKNASHCSSFTSLNESSSVGPEVSDVEMAAMSLLMLSKGLRDDVRLDSVAESSGDSSDYYGGGSCCETEKIAVSDSETSLSTRMVGFCDLGSKFVAEMTMKVGFEVSDELMCDVGGDSGGGIRIDCDPDLKSFGSTKVAGVDKDVHAYETLPQFLKSKSFKKPPSDSVHKSAENVVGRVDDTSNDSRIKHTYKRRTPGKFIATSSSMYMNASLLCDSGLAKESGTVRRKEFKCLACFKVFSSGQALGGHKRAHFTRSTVNITGKATNVDHQEVGGLFDLKYPVIVLEA